MDDLELFSVVNSAIILVAQAIVVARAAWLLRVKLRSGGNLRGVSSELWSQLSSMWLESTEAGFQDKLNARRLDIGSACAKGGTALGAVCSFLVYVQVTTSSHSFLNHSLRMAFGVLLLLWSIVSWRPRLMSVHTLPWMYMLSMSILAISVSPICSITCVELLASRSLLGVVGLGMGTIWLRPTLIVVGNLLFCTCFISSYAMHYTEESDLMTPIYLSSVEFVVVLIQSAFMWAAGIIVEFGVQQEVEQNMGKCQMSGVMSLLDLMCDVVIDLEKDLTLKAHSPKLAGMLVHGTGKSLHGASIIDFIVNEDRPIVANFVKPVVDADCSETDTSGMYNVHLRDSMGNSVKTILYHVPYCSGSGHVYHLIGLREDDSAQGESRVADLKHNLIGNAMAPSNPVSSIAGAGLGTPCLEGSRSPAQTRTLSIRGSYVPAGMLRPEMQRRLDKLSAEFQPPRSPSITDRSQRTNGSPTASSTRSLGNNHRQNRESGGAPEPSLIADLFMDEAQTFSHASELMVSRFGIVEGTSLRDLLFNPEDAFVGWLEQMVAAVLVGGRPHGVATYGCLEIARVADPPGSRRPEHVAPEGFTCKVFFPGPNREPSSVTDRAPYRVSIKLRPRNVAAQDHRAHSGSGTRARTERQSLHRDDEPTRSASPMNMLRM